MENWCIIASHTHTHTHAHTRTHTHTHTRAHAHTHTHHKSDVGSFRKIYTDNAYT